MKISYAITVCNEASEIQKLISFIFFNKRDQDEIVVLFDSKNGTKEVEDYLNGFGSIDSHFRYYSDEFDGRFDDWKNKLTKHCTGDYIFQIDADELPHSSLIKNLPTILDSNPDNEVYLVPRVNTVEGLTQEHITKWRWNVNDKGWVNWPDYQWRVWKNKSGIFWRNRVHEVLGGFKTYANLPMEEEFALYHPKDIKRQEKQNQYYDTL